MRLLFFSDTHLGFDDPRRPRITRRRRGPDFMDSFARVLERAVQGDVDLLVHGGDVFFRSRVRCGLVAEVQRMLRRISDRGIPILVVPGNHERSALPQPLLWNQPHVHVFDRPRTYLLKIGALRVALAGFPFGRAAPRRTFARRLAATGWTEPEADIRLLCIHQAVEGVVVGPRNFTFRRGADAVLGSQVPRQFAAILAGHIHRHQILLHDLRGRPLGCPVFIAGSTERTSFAEEDERKGFLILDVCPTDCGRGEVRKARFEELTTRPMVTLPLELGGLSRHQATQRIRRALSGLAADSVVRIFARGDLLPAAAEAVGAAALRALAPPTMNVALARPYQRRTSTR